MFSRAVKVCRARFLHKSRSLRFYSAVVRKYLISNIPAKVRVLAVQIFQQYLPLMKAEMKDRILVLKLSHHPRTPT